MEKRKIKVGIIGAGRMGITHYSILNSHPELDITCVVDTTPVVNSLLEKYLPVNTYKSHSIMFEREELDAIIVCTPPALNYDILVAAARNGLHAFVEKPGTLSALSASELATLYESRKLVLQVGYVNRFNDVFVKTKYLLDQDILGEVIRFRSEMYSRTIIREDSGSSWRSTREQGGGAVYEMASHSIDLVNYFFGRPDAVVGSCLSSVYSKNVEDIVSSNLLYKSGMVGSLHVNWSDESYRKPTNKIEMFGKKGRMLADQHGLKVYLASENEKFGFRAGWNSLSIIDVFSNVPFFVRGIEFTAQLYHFIDCIGSGGSISSRCSFRNAADALHVIEQIFVDALKSVNKVAK